METGGGQKERSVGSSILSLLHPLPPQQQLVVHTLITHCNYTLPPLPSANRVVDSSQTNKSTISASTKLTTSPPIEQRGIISISQQQPSRHHNQRVCCDHQFTDRCSMRESPTRPHSSPLAGSTGFARRRFAPAPAPSTHSTHSTPTRTYPNTHHIHTLHSLLVLDDPLPGVKKVSSACSHTRTRNSDLLSLSCACQLTVGWPLLYPIFCRLHAEDEDYNTIGIHGLLRAIWSYQDLGTCYRKNGSGRNQAQQVTRYIMPCSPISWGTPVNLQRRCLKPASHSETISPLRS